MTGRLEWSLQLLETLISECAAQDTLPNQKRDLLLFKLRAFSMQMRQRRLYTLAMWAKLLHSHMVNYPTVNEGRKALRALAIEQTPDSNTGVNSAALEDYIAGA